MACTKIASTWNFHRVQLTFEQWTNLAKNEHFLASAPYYASTDGLLLIVRDTTHEEREMTAAEREMYNCEDYESNMFAGGKASGDRKAGGYTGPKEQGVKITVKKA
jgi:hypothetical protein